MKFLMCGAGSIGRCFIGPLFSQAGYDVLFVDISRPVRDALNNRRGYPYTVAAEVPYDIQFSGVRGVDGLDEQAVVKEITSCDLMATALGATALQKVVTVIAKGFLSRMKENGRPLNILICENLKDAAHVLRGWLSDALPEEDRRLLATHCA